MRPSPSIGGASGATGRRVADAGATLRLRVLSALVLAPAAIALVVLGGWFFVDLVALMLVIAAIEWRGLVRARFTHAAGIAATLAALAVALAVILLASLGHAALALALLLAAVPLGAALARLLGSAALWTGLGIAYLGAPALALVWLRSAAESGLAMLIWLLLVVWATDTAAYIAGRLLGGPRLAPRISPSKTWSGLGGGMLGAGLVGALAAALAGSERLAQAAGLGAALAVVAQIGDLAESALKRRAGLKDSGRLIPGHGGLLDRVDGLLFAAPALALAVLLLGPRIAPWP